MEYLNPGASLGENILPEEKKFKKPHQKLVFSNNVKEQNFAFGNAPSNVRTMNTRNLTLRNNKNTRKAYAKGYAPRLNRNSTTKRNILEYQREINTKRRNNYLKRGNAARMNINVASSKNPLGEKWLREKKPQFKFPAGLLGYSNTTNNLTRKAYKHISNLSQKQAQNWARKVHYNQVFGR